MKNLIYAFVLLLAAAAAQDKPKLSAEQQNAVLKAQRAVDAVDSQITALQQKYAEAQLFLKNAQETYNGLAKQQRDAESLLKAEETKALTELKLDPAKFEIDKTSLEIVQKVDKEKK
jgi:hypothetical protein